MRSVEDRRRAYSRGLRAEYAAAVILILKGYRILKMRYKTPLGEIDIVCRKGSALVFVEVKIRSSLDEALESVHGRSRKRISRAAQWYMGRENQKGVDTMRFDVLAFAPPFSWRHLDNAWQADT